VFHTLPMLFIKFFLNHKKTMAQKYQATGKKLPLVIISPKRHPITKRKLPIVLITNKISHEVPLRGGELERPPPSRPAGDLSRAILYFRGLGRRPIWEARQLFAKVGIAPQAIQFVSFIGANVAELILLGSFKEDVVRRLATMRVEHDSCFDPLSPRSFTNAATIERLALAGKSVVEQSVAARKAFVLRMDSMLQAIAGHRRGLRSFLRSLRRAVEVGEPIGRFLNPLP
jgi:hypothetical protein